MITPTSTIAHISVAGYQMMTRVTMYTIKLSDYVTLGGVYDRGAASPISLFIYLKTLKYI